MSVRSLPRSPDLHSRTDVAIGARLNAKAGRGCEHAKLIWFAVLARQNWTSLTKPAWATDTTLMHHSGLGCLRDVERAVQVLRDAGMLTTPTGVRPTAKRRRGRLLKPSLGAPVKVLIPDRHDTANLWALCRSRRQRPASLVTTTVGAYVLACDGLGRRPDDWAPVPCSLADLRRFVGARKNAAWTQRLRDLEGLGVLRRNGRRLEISPPRSWWPAWRALDDSSRGPPLVLAA